MSDQKIGIEELKALLLAINEAGLSVVKMVKGGVVAGVEDLIANEAFKNSLAEVVAGASKIPSEVKDLDVAEVMDLVGQEIALLPKIMEALKA